MKRAKDKDAGRDTDVKASGRGKTRTATAGRDGSRTARATAGRDGSRTARATAGRDGSRTARATAGRDGSRTEQATAGRDGSRTSPATAGRGGSRTARATAGRDGSRTAQATDGRGGARTSPATAGRNGPFAAPAGRNLLNRPDAALLASLEQALDAITAAFPVPASHRKDMPRAVRDLSQLLTAERGELGRSYWAAPRLFSAYLHFFLPWNLCRLAWLLPGLDLPLRAGAHILDLGSGPLTLPMALWCARPDLRATALTFFCCDVAAQPMQAGRAALAALAGPGSPWRIIQLRAPVEKALQTRPPESLACVMAGNVLNEICTRSGLTGSAMSQRLDRIIRQAHALLAPEGRLFLLEPGTRLGGTLISLSRRSALQTGFLPLAPCPHSGPCPMPGGEPDEDAAHGRPGRIFSGWCHFTHPADTAPAALLALGKSARLEKDSLALSCLLLRKAAQADGIPAQEGGMPGAHGPDEKKEASPPKDTPAQGPKPHSPGPDARPAGRNASGPCDELDELEALYAEIMAEDAALTHGPAAAPHVRAAARLPVASSEALPGGLGRIRVISAPIRLPDDPAPGRYACCERGLALLLDSLRVPSGASVTLPWPEREERDAKTGALLLRRPAHAQPQESSPPAANAEGHPETRRKRPPTKESAPHREDGAPGAPRKTAGKTAGKTAKTTQRPRKKTGRGENPA